MRNQRAIGITEILLSGVCFGFLGIFGKYAYQAGLLPGELLSLRFVIAALLGWLGLALFRPKLLQLNRKAILSCAGLGSLGYAVFSSCYFEALRGLSASLTVLLLYTYPVMVTLGARVLFGERISGRAWAALPIVLSGMLLLVWNDLSVSHSLSLLFGIGSAVFYAVYILASSRLLRSVQPITAALYIQTSAAIALSFIHLRNPAHWLPLLTSAWPSVLGLAVVSTTLAMTLFLSGLQKIPSSETSILSAAEPITAVFAAAFLLGEGLGPLQISGGFCILFAMILTVYQPRTKLD